MVEADEEEVWAVLCCVGPTHGRALVPEHGM